jgi:hypothetical protein
MHLLFECAQCSEPLWELVGEAITALIRQASPTAQTYRVHAHVQYTTYMMVRFRGSLPAIYGMVPRNLKGLNLPQIQKVHWYNHPA